MLLNLLGLNLPFNYLIGLLVIHLFCVVMALTLHEVAHGYAAYKMGDPTAKQQGRLSINPVAHIDPMGFLMMLLVGFGWAKPVPINTYQMRNPKKGLGLTALAGPAVNICLALISGISASILFSSIGGDALFAGTWLANLDPLTKALYLIVFSAQAKPIFVLYYFLCLSCALNIGLALFNLIPLPPLDGSNIVVSLLPHHKAAKYLQIRYYTQYIFWGLIGLSVLARYIPLANKLYSLIWLPFNTAREFLINLIYSIGFAIFELFT